MAAYTLERATYRDKVLGAYLGKAVGATLGTPFEAGLAVRSVQFYTPVPGQSVANDGLDMQLIAIQSLKEKGICVTSEELAEAWNSRVTYLTDAYGWARYNLGRGLDPPITGGFNNWYRGDVRAASRCELWAVIAPGASQIAAEYAYRDAVIDHSGEGVWAAMFWAALESAAFVVTDAPALIEIGLAMIPPASRVAEAVRIARDSHVHGTGLLEARALILKEVGTEFHADAPQNIGLAALALLYGGGTLGGSVCTATNIGLETRFTAGAVGAVIGILLGAAALPLDWTAPIGDVVVLGWGVDVDAPRRYGDLADRIAAIGEEVVTARCPDVELVDRIEPPAPSAPILAPEVAAPAEATVEEPTPIIEPIPAVEPTPPDSVIAASDDADTVPEEQVRAAMQAAPPSGPEHESASLLPDSAPSVAEPAADAIRTVEPPEISAPAPPLDAAPQAQPPPPPVPSLPDLRQNGTVQPLWTTSSFSAVTHAGEFEVTVDYGEAGPVLLPNVAVSFTVAVRNCSAEDFVGRLGLRVPEGWQVAAPAAQGQRQMIVAGGMARYGFVLKAPETAPLMTRNEVILELAPEAGTPVLATISYVGGTCWWIAGPFRNVAEEGFGHAYAPEDKPGLEETYLGRDGGMSGWRKMPFGENVLGIESLFNGSPGVAYGVTMLHVPATTDVRITVQSNDGVKVWLNGSLAYQRHSHDTFRPSLADSPGTFDVTLKPGDNRLMMKVVRCGAPAELAVAITDRRGRPIGDLGNSRW